MVVFAAVAVLQWSTWVIGRAILLRLRLGPESVLAAWGIGTALRFGVGLTLRGAHLWSFAAEGVLHALFLIWALRAVGPIQKGALGAFLFIPRIAKVFFVFYFLLLLAGAATPAVWDPDWDAVDTWIPMYRELSRSGGFVARPDLLYQQLALGARLLLQLPFEIAGGLGVKVFNLSTLILLCVGFYELFERHFGRRFQNLFQKRTTALAVFFLVLTNPAFMQNATIALHDILFVGLILGALLLAEQGSRSWFAVGLLLGVAGTTKSVGFFQATYIFCSLLLFSYLGKRFELRSLFKHASLGLLGIALISLPLLGVIYLLTGNPVYPLASQVFQSPWIDDGLRAQLSGLSNLSRLTSKPWDFFTDLIWGWVRASVRWSGFDFKTSPLLIGLLPLGLWSLRQKIGKGIFIQWLGFAVALYLLWQITNLNARYLYPAYLAFVPIAVAGFHSLWQTDRLWKKSVIYAAVGFITVQTFFQHKRAVVRVLTRQSSEDYQTAHAFAGKTSERLRAKGLWGTPKILIGAEHVDLFGFPTYLDHSSFLGTTYIQASEYLKGNPEQIARIKSLGVSIFVVPVLDTQDSRVDLLRDALLARAEWVEQAEDGVIIKVRDL